MDARQALVRVLEDSLAWVINRPEDYDFENDDVLWIAKEVLRRVINGERTINEISEITNG